MSDDRVVFLGTSGAIPTPERNLSAVLVQLRGDQFLFDVGEDIQRRFVQAGAGLNKNLCILVSHLHADHINGLPGLLFRFGLADRTRPLTIIGPPGLVEYFTCHQRTLGLNPAYPLHLIEIHPDQATLVHYRRASRREMHVEEVPAEHQVAWETPRYLVKYALGEHGVPNLSYGLFQKPRKGKFNPHQARALQVPEGRLWKSMHEGKCVTVAGREIDPQETGIVGPPRQGKVVLYSGDTRPVVENFAGMMETLPFAVPYTRINVLIHEAMFLDEHAQLALDKKHSTAREVVALATALAAKYEIRHVLLTHISSRYKDLDAHVAEIETDATLAVQFARDLLEVNLHD